jgi:hypothetical protein
MQRKAGWNHQCRYERDPWRDVVGQYVVVSEEDWSSEAEKGEVEANKQIRPALRKYFLDGPSVAARTQADYLDWMERSQDSGSDAPMTRGARRWLGFLEVWKNAVRALSGRQLRDPFQRLVGVDFGAAVDRGRGREGTD